MYKFQLTALCLMAVIVMVTSQGVEDSPYQLALNGRMLF